jgi:cytochrome c-type biogenesis protein CcmF
LLVNNVLLLVAAGTVFLGTLYPLFLDALDMGKISVGAPYFEAVFVPIMIPVLLLMAAAPFMRWKDASMPELVRTVRWVALGSFAPAVVIGLVMHSSAMSVLGLTLAMWIIAATVWHLVRRVRSAPAGTSWWRVAASQPRSYWGMFVAHIGIGVFVVGVTMVKSFDVANDVSMQVGDTTTANGYVFKMTDLKDIQGPNYTSKQGTFEVTRDGAKIATLQPEKRIFTVQQMPMTEAAIDRGFTRDIYVSLGEPVNNSTWVVRVQIKPFVSWLWSGCLIMAFGGLLAASDRRYRRAARIAQETAKPAASGRRPVNAAA